MEFPFYRCLVPGCNHQEQFNPEGLKVLPMEVEHNGKLLQVQRLISTSDLAEKLQQHHNRTRDDSGEKRGHMIAVVRLSGEHLTVNIEKIELSWYFVIGVIKEMDWNNTPIRREYPAY
jgi:hypothetical protein